MERNVEGNKTQEKCDGVGDKLGCREWHRDRNDGAEREAQREREWETKWGTKWETKGGIVGDKG